MIYFAL